MRKARRLSFYNFNWVPLAVAGVLCENGEALRRKLLVPRVFNRIAQIA